MLGSGDKYQILVYDGQKVPQLVTPLHAGFTYNLRDLYVSLADSNGVNWSILFDSVESLYLVLRNSFGAATQVAGIVETSDQMFKGMLPPVSVANADDPVLDVGMFAGVYITIYEMGEMHSYPSFVMTETPFKQVTPPSEVVKVRIGADDDFVGGLSASLVGHKKGERFMLALPPMVAYKNGVDKAELTTKRIRPTTWLYAEVEVSKVKTEKKKEPTTAAVTVDSTTTTAAATPVAPSESTNDLTARMARLAQQAGGGGAIMPVSPGKSALDTRHVEVTANSLYQQNQNEQQALPPQQPQQQQTPPQSTGVHDQYRQQPSPSYQQQPPTQHQQHQQQHQQQSYQPQQHLSPLPNHQHQHQQQQQQSYQQSPQQYDN